MAELGVEEKQILSLDIQKKCYLIKAPKFVASQWRSEKENTIVGVLVDAVNSSSITPTITPNIPCSSKKDSLHRKRKETARHVVLSSDSLAYHSAMQGQQKSLNIPLTSKPAQSTREDKIIQQLRFLRIDPSQSQHLYLFSHREGDALAPQDEEPDSAFDSSELDFRNTSVGKVSPVQGNILRNAPDGLAAQATITATWALIPELDAQYHSLVKLRNEKAKAATRATQPTHLIDGANVHLNSQDNPSLFRYYHSKMFETDDLQDTIDARQKSRQFKTRMDSGLRLEPGSADAIARRDALKEKLFTAFEHSPNNEGTLSIQDILKMSGETYHYIKPILSQIAEPVRTSERKRLIYMLKPEFRHVQ